MDTVGRTEVHPEHELRESKASGDRVRRHGFHAMPLRSMNQEPPQELSARGPSQESPGFSRGEDVNP